jgi:hypothetical protein
MHVHMDTGAQPPCKQEKQDETRVEQLRKTFRVMYRYYIIQPPRLIIEKLITCKGCREVESVQGALVLRAPAGGLRNGRAHARGGRQ